MLPADHRLRDSDSFRRTARSGRKAAGAALVVHLHVAAGDAEDASDAGPARAGFVVGRTVGNAVVRNRVRRRLRECVRRHLTMLPTGSALVVRALPGSATLGSTELDAELVRCLERALAAGAAAARTGAAS